LNKYNIAFLALGFIPALLITKQRRIFTNSSFVWISHFSFTDYSSQSFLAVSEWFSGYSPYERTFRKPIGKC
jgi:hypothetical protein